MSGTKTTTVYCGNEAHGQPVLAIARVAWPSGRFRPTTACAVCLNDLAADYIGGEERHSMLIDPIGSRGGYEQPRPPVVCLCGSTRFVDEFNRHRKALTEAGEIVLSIEVVTTQAREDDPQHTDPDLKARLDQLHRRKIDLADYCLIVSDETGYFGESTTGEIRYAADHRKPILFDVPASEKRARDAGLIR